MIVAPIRGSSGAGGSRGATARTETRAGTGVDASVGR